MPETDFSSEAWKAVFKQALVETLEEHREFFHDVFAEVLEDLALQEAIRQGELTHPVSRQEIFDRLEGRE